MSLYGNATNATPSADAWCLYEIDSSDSKPYGGDLNPKILDGYGVSLVERISTGVHRIYFTNPERFQGGAYVSIGLMEVGNAPIGYGIVVPHGTTASADVTSGGFSASCDVSIVGFDSTSTAAPTFLVDNSYTHRIRVNMAFFSLRSDADINKMRVANYAANTENMSFIAPSGSSGGTILVPNAAIAPDGTNTAVGVRITSNSLGVRKTIQANIGAATSGGVHGKPWNGSIYVKSGEASRVLKGASANVSLFDNGIVGGGGVVMLNTDTGATATASISSDFLGFKVENAGNGWWRISSSIKTKNTTYPGYRNLYLGFIANQTAGAGDELSWSGNGSIEFYVWGTQLEEGTSPTPYVRTTFSNPGTNAQNNFVLGNQDVLVRSSNSGSGYGTMTYQNLFHQTGTATPSASWTLNNCGISTGFTAPDGSTTAYKIWEHQAAENTVYRNFYVANSQTFGTTAGGTPIRTVSFYAKAQERQYVRIIDGNSGQWGDLVIDLVGGVVTQNTRDYEVSVTSAGDGWWRIAATRASRSNISNSYQQVGFSTESSPKPPISGIYGSRSAGVSGSGILFWHPQLNSGTIYGDYAQSGASRVGTTFSRQLGLTYTSALGQLQTGGVATAWGTIVVPAALGNSTGACAYLENYKGVSSVSASGNSTFDVKFEKQMASDTYCVVTGIETQTVHLSESGLGLAGSIPPTDEFVLPILQASTADSQRRRDGFTIRCLRQDPADNLFKQQSIHHQRGREFRIHFMVFGGKQIYGAG